MLGAWRASWLITLTAHFAAIVGCSTDSVESDGPEVTALSTQSLAVGESLTLTGKGLVKPSKGWVDVTFLGKFYPASASGAAGAGSEAVKPLPAAQASGEVVNLTVALSPDEAGALQWERFGSYRVPFGGGLETGRFEGQVIATNRLFDESERPAVASAGLSTRIDVGPSIVLAEARALGKGWQSSCREPSTTVINGVPYLFRFRALGFEAKTFDYTLGQGFVVGGAATTSATHYSVPMLEPEHAVLLEFASVPVGSNGFRTSISIDAVGTDGAEHHLELPLVVRQPLQVFFPAPTEIAEIYPPELVSGCIPGGKSGMEVTYSESKAETRTRSVTSTETDGWTENYGKQYAETYSNSKTQQTATASTQTSTVTDGRSQSWSDSWQYGTTRGEQSSTTAQIGFTKTDTHSFAWNVGGEISAGVSAEVGTSATAGVSGGLSEILSGKVDVGVQTKLGVQAGVKVNGGISNTDTTSKSYSANLARTYGTSFSESLARSFGTQWGVSQSYAESNSYSTQKSLANTTGYAEAVTNSQTNGTQGSTSESETDTVSTTTTTALNTKGDIAAGMQGVWYRQTTRLVRRGVVVAFDLCGNGEAVGQVALDDWTWAPNLAVGESCPPPSDLPAAGCFVEPCDN
jgi:hypothetical protein